MAPIPVRSSPKKTIIAVVVSAILCGLGGWFGRDLTGFQAVGEQAAAAAVDATEHAIHEKGERK